MPAFAHISVGEPQPVRVCGICYDARPQLQMTKKAKMAMFRHRIYPLLMLPLLLLAACQAFVTEDVPATLAYELDAYATEAAALQGQLVAESTRRVATQVVAETRAANYYAYNGVLLATVRANAQPTSARRIVDVRPGTSAGSMDDMDMMDMPQVSALGGGSTNAAALPGSRDEMRISEMRLAATIESFTRCATSQPQDVFRAEQTDVIYLTTIIDNLRSGTRIAVDWRREGLTQFEGIWVADTDASRICVAMELSADSTALLGGNWQAQLFVNNQAFDPLAFTVIGR